jgi:hypothetical protein
VQVLRPNSADRLQAGSSFRVQWEAIGVSTPDWSLFLSTNQVPWRQLAAVPVHEGGTRWQADIVVPGDVPPGCDYTVLVREDVTGAADSSDPFCLGFPVLEIRVAQVEVCWSSRTNRTYQLQYRSTSTTNVWINLGVSVQGNGATNCVTDTVVPGEVQKYYRVKELP